MSLRAAWSSLRQIAREQPAVLLLALLFALLPVGRSAELPLLIMAGLGLRLLPELVRGLQANVASDRGQRLAALLFLGYWLPELLSAFDSVAPQKSWTEVAVDLRFLPFLLYAQRALGQPGAAALCLRLIAALLALWCVDALIQAAFGVSLGGANRVDRLSGIFGDENLKLGSVMAALSPLLLVPLRLRFGWPAFAAAAIALLVVVLMAGARAAWLSYALVLALMLWHAIPRLRLRLLALGISAGLAILAGTLAYSGSERFAERIERSAAALSGDQRALDHALSYRLPIWRAALSMFQAHPINGVGVRGYRYAYPLHSDADDRFLMADPAGKEQGAFHAHQLLLEILAETGGLGLLCWLAAAAGAIVYLRDQAAPARRAALPAGLVLLALLFPFNTHYAVYSSFQSLLLMGAVALWLGLLGARERRSIESSPAR